MESIDNRADFRVYMQNYAVAHTGPRGPRREGPWEEGFVRQTAARWGTRSNTPYSYRHYRRIWALWSTVELCRAYRQA